MDAFQRAMKKLSSLDRDKLLGINKDLSASSKNTIKLGNALASLLSRGFSPTGIVGYGEGVFTITVYLTSKNGSQCHLRIPQSSEDGDDCVLSCPHSAPQFF